MNTPLKGPFGEELQFKEKLSKSLLNNKNSFWFVDSFFKNHLLFKSLKNVRFLKAGEKSKSLDELERNLKKLLEVNANRKTTVYCVGGGSIGDSIGFLCSVYMRGVDFIMLPTTWLSCVDSSVGGKTALNAFGYKNLIGSFYPPIKSIFIKELVESSSLKDAEGEILKTLFLNHNKKWSKSLMKNWDLSQFKFEDLQNFVSYKTRIVKKDFNDTKGIRAVLNMGHSLGHALELEKGLSHGDAVKQGLLFSLRWSSSKGILSPSKALRFEKMLPVNLIKISNKSLIESLQKDKKSESGESLKFVFISDSGPVVESVKLKVLLQEYKRQLCLNL